MGAPAVAFVSKSGPSMVSRKAISSSMTMEYIPDGLTLAQWKALQAKKAGAAAARKKKFSFKGPVETLTEFQAKRDKKFPNSPGAGHEYVKLKGAGKGLGVGYGKADDKPKKKGLFGR